jgi:hypothetical protein
MQFTRSAALILVGLAACSGEEEALRQQLAELSTVSAEKDSLLLQVTDNARLMSEISSQLVQVADQEKLATTGSAAESPMAASRDSLRVMVADVTERVVESEERLAQSRRRIRGLSRVSDSLKTVLEASLMQFQVAIESQTATMLALSENVSRLEAKNFALDLANRALADSIEQVAQEANRVYYIVGTKDELVEQGIVTKEGGARFLFIFGKRGETLVPARTLDPAQFIAIDRRAITEIELPDPEAEYTIASRQDLTRLEVPPDEDGRVRNALRITSPEAFWAPSKFLIVVRS